MHRTPADLACHDLRPLWRRYRATRDPKIRDTLIRGTVHLVRRIAGRLALRLPLHVEHSDLQSAGIPGLLAAIETYDPDRDTEFAAYAESRIRGAILDELRALDPVSRPLRAMARSIERTVRTLQQERLREPTDEEVAARLGVSLDAYHDTLCTLPRCLHVTFRSTDSRRGVADAADAAPLVAVATDPLDQASLNQRRALLAALIDQLPKTERIVLRLYYHDGLSMKEVATVLGVTEARVSQIHTAAIIRLRGRLRQRHVKLDDLRTESHHARAQFQGACLMYETQSL